MSNMTDSDALLPFTRTCQIIIGALVMGVVSFLVIVVLFIRLEKPLDPPIITYVALAMGASVLAMSFFVPGAVITQMRRQIAKGAAPPSGKSPEEKTVLLPIYQTQLIIGAALLEGGAFFATIAYMLERKPIALAAAGVLLGVLLTRFPTIDRLRGWIDRQTETMLEER